MVKVLDITGVEAVINGKIINQTYNIAGLVILCRQQAQKVTHLNFFYDIKTSIPNFSSAFTVLVSILLSVINLSITSTGFTCLKNDFPNF